MSRFWWFEGCSTDEVSSWEVRDQRVEGIGLTLRRRDLHPEFEIVAIGLGRGRIPVDRHAIAPLGRSV